MQPSGSEPMFRWSRRSAQSIRCCASLLRRGAWWVIFGVLLALSAMIASVRAQTRPAPTECGFSAWTHDSDPEGTNLRSGPSRQAAVIAKLPKLATGYGVEFRVIGTSGGWFLIEGAEDPDYDQKGPRDVYTGRGWISGRLLTSSIASQDLVSAPRDGASVVLALGGSLNGSAYGPDSVAVRQIISCKGSWTQVQVEDPPTRKLYTGWVARMCGNQVTTCP